MSSQGTGLEILEKLSEWSSEEIQDNIHQIIQELLIYLNGEDKGSTLQSVYALLVTCLPSVSFDIADECLLRHAIPTAQLLFNESLEGIKLCLGEKSNSELSDVAETLSSLLQVCIEILKCIESVLQYILLQGNINISCVASVPKTVASILLQTFRHCKESEALYRDAFSAVADVLGAMFRQCHQVQCCFFAVITSHISFDCSVQTDLMYLVDVLQILSEVGEHVMGLDIKTLAEHWKGFTKILQMYLEHLRQKWNVSYPVSYLCSEIENNLDQLTNQESPKDPKGISKLLKTTSFILKIVVKLCEQFGCGEDSLGNCYSNLYQLLLSLNRSSSSFLITRNFDSSLVNDIERHLIVAAEPLLSHLISEDNFREEFFIKSETVLKIQDDRLPHLLLLLSVMKKLVVLNPDRKSPWLGEEKKKNVVGCLLEILKFSHMELSSEIWLPAVVKSGEAPRKYDLYEALCCHCAGLVLTLNTDQFQNIESILLDSVLEPSIWPALMSGDIWCICARAGSSELVLDQVLFLAEIISSLEPSNLGKRTEWKFLSLLLRRMCSFLSAKGKQILMSQYPPLDHPWMWYIFGLSNFSKDIQESVSQTLITHSISSVEKFLGPNPSEFFYYKMIASLFGLCGVFEASFFKMQPLDNQNNAIVPQILSLWQYVSKVEFTEQLQMMELFDSGTEWLVKLVEILCRCSEYLIHFMSNEEIIQVLKCLDRVINCSQSVVKLYVLQILHGLATKVLEGNADQDLVCSKVAKTFSCLLKYSNPLVQEAALETFEYFAHFTAHESIVAQAVADNRNIQDIVALYLQKAIPVMEPHSNLLDAHKYLIFQAKMKCTHVCQVKKVRNVSPEHLSEKPAKKICLEGDDLNLSAFLADDLLADFVDNDVTEAISRIYRDVQFIISQGDYQTIPPSSQKDLIKAVNELKMFVK